MPYIVDASVAIKWLIVEEDTARAVQLLNSGEQLLAPRWVMIDIANVLWKKCRQRFLTPRIASQRLSLATRYFARLLDDCKTSVVFDMAIKARSFRVRLHLHAGCAGSKSSTHFRGSPFASKSCPNCKPDRC